MVVEQDHQNKLSAYCPDKKCNFQMELDDERRDALLIEQRRWIKSLEAHVEELKHELRWSKINARIIYVSVAVAVVFRLLFH